jgi:hypothetical protein
LKDALSSLPDTLVCPWIWVYLLIFLRFTNHILRSHSFTS